MCRFTEPGGRLPSRSRVVTDESEKGVYITFFALFLVVTTAVVAFALDAGTIYLTRLSLQSSADAGAVSGLAKLAMTWDNGVINTATISKNAGEAAAREIALANIVLKGVEDVSIPTSSLIANGKIVAVARYYDQVAPGLSAGEEDYTQMDVTITVRPKLYLLARLPGFAQTHEVSVTASARLIAARVALLLDSSASMACPKNGVCDCLTANVDGCPVSGSKMEALRPAAIQFIRRFNEVKDSVSLFAFANAAEELAGMQAVGFNAAAIRDIIDDSDGVTPLQPYGATNLPDAIFRAWIDAAEAGHESRVSMVALTDGSSTATRVVLRDPVANPGTNCIPAGCAHHHPTISNFNPLNQGWSLHDYVQVAQVLDTGSAGLLPTPYSLVITPGYPETAGSHNNYWTRELPYPEDSFYRVLWSLQNPATPSSTYSFLFNTPNYYMPGGPEYDPFTGSEIVRRYGPFWNGTNFNWAMYDDIDPFMNRSGFLVEYMNHALAYADYVRRRGGSVSTIALGELAADPMTWPPPWGPDVYQTRDNRNVKNFYLWRLAYSRCFAAGQALINAWGSSAAYATSSYKDFYGFESYSQLKANKRKHGFYMQSPNPEDIDELFQRTVLRLRMSLIK